MPIKIRDSCETTDPVVTTDEAITVTITDDQDVLLIVRDKIVDLKTGTLVPDDILVVQDQENGPVINSKFLTAEQILELVDAGPVFKGPPGPSNYELWLAAGNIGSLDDFFQTLHGGPGEQGPPGVIQNFVHEQYDASALWTIVHGLDKYPDVVLIDSAGDRFEADINYFDRNTVVLTLIAPTTGTAVLE
jgi:hypothetical protein